MQDHPSIDYHGHRLGHLRFGAGFHAVYAPDAAAAPHALPLAQEPSLYRAVAAPQTNRGHQAARVATAWDKGMRSRRPIIARGFPKTLVRRLTGIFRG
jgi:hypothetical protein